MDDINQDIVANVSQIIKTKPSYFNNPTKEEAILLSVVPGIDLKNYLLEVGKLINPNNIRFASVLPTNEVCIYLTSKQLVDVLVLNFQDISIDEHRIKIRRLVANKQKITLTNVSPTLPSRIVEKALKSINMKLLSSVTTVKYNFLEKELMHIKSFTREVIVSNDETIVVPEKLIIRYEDGEYEICISTDSLVCSKCRETGHLVTKCNNEKFKENMDLEVITDDSDNENIKIVRQQKRSIETTDPETGNKYVKLDDGVILEVVDDLGGKEKKVSKKNRSLTETDVKNQPLKLIKTSLLTMSGNPSVMESSRVVRNQNSGLVEPPPLLIKNIKKSITTEPPPLIRKNNLPLLTEIPPLIIKNDVRNRRRIDPPPLTKYVVSTEPPPLALITTENNINEIEEIKIEPTDVDYEDKESNREFLTKNNLTESTPNTSATFNTFRR